MRVKLQSGEHTKDRVSTLTMNHNGVTFASTSLIKTDSHRPSSICPKLSSNAPTPNTDDIPGHFSATKRHHPTRAQTIAGFGYGSLNHSLADSGTCIHTEYHGLMNSVHEGFFCVGGNSMKMLDIWDNYCRSTFISRTKRSQPQSAFGIRFASHRTGLGTIAMVFFFPNSPELLQYSIFLSQIFKGYSS